MNDTISAWRRWLLALLLAAAACGDSGSGAPTADEATDRTDASAPASDVVIRWGVFKNYQPVFIAQRLGYFEDEGVDVEFTGAFTSGSAIVQAAGTGDVDAGHSAITGIVDAVAAGVEIVGVADSQTEFEDAPLMQWFVRDDSGIEQATDLQGKTIGTNSLSGSFYETMLLFLADAGMTKDDVTFVQIPHHNQEQALLTGQIDVAGVIDPYSVHLAGADGVRLLTRAVDIFGERQFSLIWFRRDVVDEHPNAVRAFVAAYQRAIDFIEEDPAQAAEIMAEELDIEADLNGVHRYTADAEVRIDDVAFWIDSMRESGSLDASATVEAEDVATRAFTGS